MKIMKMPPNTLRPWTRQPPPEVAKELVSLSQQGAVAYGCAMAGMVSLTGGLGVAGAGLWLRSSRTFAVGLSLAAVGGSLVPISWLTLGKATLRAEELERQWR